MILYVGNDGIIKDIQPIGTEGKDGSGEIEFFSTTSIVFSGYLGDEYSFNNSTIGVENTNNFIGGIYDFDAKIVTFAFSSDGSQESDARANTAEVLSNDSFFLGGRAEPFESTIHSIEVEGSEESAVGIVFSIDSDSDDISDFQKARAVVNSRKTLNQAEAARIRELMIEEQKKVSEQGVGI